MRVNDTAPNSVRHGPAVVETAPDDVVASLPASEPSGEHCRPRVLHVLDHSIPLQSGYAFRTLAILSHQRARGWTTIHLTGPKQGHTMALEEEVDGWAFHRTPGPSAVAALPGLRYWGIIRAIERRLEAVATNVRPDILHAHSPALNAVATLRAGRRLGIPVIYEVRAFWEDAASNHGTSREGGLRYRLTRALETWALRRVDAITTICEGLRGDILDRGIPGERVTVIPNAVDPERFGLGGEADPELQEALGLRGTRVLGFIGSLYAYEGLDLLLQALPTIIESAPDVRVLLVGGGPAESVLRTLASDVGVADKVAFVGRVPHSEIGRYYDLVDVLVYPRHSIRLTDLVTPLKPLEAMAQGRLLVASDVGGHRELIRDGVTGVLFRAGDPDDLARNVLDLLADEARWPGLRQRARAFVEEERSWTASVARYEPVYRGLLGDAGSP